MSEYTPLAPLTACISLLPAAFRESHAQLLRPDLLDRLASRLATLHRDGIPTGHPPPHFAAEQTPSLDSAYAPFAAAMRAWAARPEGPAPAVAAAFAESLVASGTRGALLLLGQRLTPGSVSDPRAIPPTVAELLEVAAQPYQAGHELGAAARALDKHVGRGAVGWWGSISGATAERNDRAAAAVRAILDRATWWNVFGHFLHGLVYEARLPTGHGARWRLRPLGFIGFLEPFGQGGE